MAWRTVDPSRFKATMRVRFPSATFESERSNDRSACAALYDDVPPVLHLGGVVRDDGYLPGADAPLHRPADRSGVWCDGNCGAGVALLHGRHRRPVLLER